MVRSSAVVSADETGLREDGTPGWCWLLRTDKVSLFHVDKSRGGSVFDKMLGSGFVGTVISDFYSVYTARDDINHGYCGVHNIREAKKIAELHNTEETHEFCQRLRTFYEVAESAQKSGDVGAQRGAYIRFGHLARSQNFAHVPDLVRLQDRFIKHKVGITAFISSPGIDWHNNRAEGDIRDIARFRAVSGGTRSANGSKNLGHWMSITQTRCKNGLPIGSFVRGVYLAHLHKTSPPSVFAP